MAAPTNRDSEKFLLRLPDGMRDRIKVAAEANSRSMNGEIVATLERAYPAVDFDQIAVTTTIKAFLNAGNQTEREQITGVLQNFLRAFGGNVSVYVDEDGEIILKGG